MLKHVPKMAIIRLSVVAAVLAAGGCMMGPRLRPTPSPLIVLRAAGNGDSGVVFKKLEEHVGMRLYDYMDGAAESYFDKGFICMGSADVRVGEIDAIVEAFQMANSGAASAIYEEMTFEGNARVAAGVASSVAAGVETEGVFVRPPYFCRIVVYGDGKDALDVLNRVAQSLDRALIDMLPVQ